MTDLATIDAPPDLKEHVAACVQWSQTNAIATADDFAETGEHLKQLKTAQKTANDFFDPPIKQAHELHKMLVARKKVITDPLATSEQLDKSKMLQYQQAEQAKAEAERRRLQAIIDEQARVERAKIEAAAQKQRDIEAAARLKAEEARRQAEQASAAERKKLLAAAEAAERKADKAAAAQDVHAEAAAAVVAPVVAVTHNAPKVAGVGTVKIWKAMIVDLAIVPREYLVPDVEKLGRMAKAMKGEIIVPGVSFYYEETMSARGR